MPAKDKYTVFTPNAVGYRKGIHKVPKWTRVRVASLRANPRLTVFTDHAKNKSQRFLVVFHVNY